MSYSLSYTAATLRIHDTLLVAKAMAEENFDGIDEKIGNGKTATGNRIRKEIMKRLENLTDNQFQYLLSASLDEARKISFVAICKTYKYIHEFVVEGEYLSYYNRKAELHPELEKISETSVYKIKQVLFKILEETGIIDSTRNKNIQFQYLSPQMEQLLKEDDPQLMRIFFVQQ
jgi:hypothetical protein